LVAIVAAVLRVPAVNFALPFVWHDDEPRNVSHGAIMIDHGSLNPHFFAYPSLLFDVVAAMGSVQKLLGAGWKPGAGLRVENRGIAMTTDPHLFIALRLVTVILSIGICVAVWGVCYLVTRKWWAATLAGLLLAVSPLMVVDGVFITPDTYSAFFTAVGLLAAIWLMRRGSRLSYVIAGAAVGLATGSKYNAVVVAVAVIGAHFLRYPQAKASLVSVDTPKQHGVPFGRLARQVEPLLLAGFAAVIAFVVTTPEAVFNFHHFFKGASGIAQDYATGHVPGYNFGSAFAFYVRTFNDQGLIFSVLVGVGVISLFGRWWRESLVMVTFVVCYGWLISSQSLYYDRDLLPAMPALAVLAALGVATITDRFDPVLRTRIWVLAIAFALVIAGLVPPITTSARQPGILADHPTAEAEAWIYKHVSLGSTVVVEWYGPWINTTKYRLVKVNLLLDTPPAFIPASAAAIVMTGSGSGRFLSDPTAFPTEVAAYRRLTSTDCLGASYTDGLWIRIFVPCRK